MPCRGRSGKSIFFEAIFVIGALVVVGHLSVNYWEKYFIQSELAEVKTSLNHLKKTITDIGYAYDNLNQELNVLTAHSITENDLPSVHTPADDHKYRSKYTVDRRNNVKVTSVITGQKYAKSNYKDNKTSDTIAKAHVTTNTNAKAAEDVSTVVSKANVISGVKNTCIQKITPAPKAKSTITTFTKPVVEESTVTTNIKPVSHAKSTITTNNRGHLCEWERTLTTNTKPVVGVNTVATNEKPVTDAKSTNTSNLKPTACTITTNTKPTTEVRTLTSNIKPVTDAKSTITTNTRPELSIFTSKIKTAEDVSTITKHPLKSTAAGLCHQHEDCIHEHHCKHSNFHNFKDNPYQRHACNTLKF